MPEVQRQNEMEKAKLNLTTESLGDLSPNEIAPHLFVILENLDHNYKKADELRTEIFAFLVKHGLDHTNPEKFTAFSAVHKGQVILFSFSYIGIINIEKTLLIYYY